MRLSHSRYREAQAVLRKLKHRRMVTLTLATVLAMWAAAIALFIGEPNWDLLGFLSGALPVVGAFLMLMTWHEWRKFARRAAALQAESKVLAIDWSTRRHFSSYLRQAGANGSKDMLFELQEEVNQVRLRWSEATDEKLKSLRDGEV